MTVIIRILKLNSHTEPLHTAGPENKGIMQDLPQGLSYVR